MASPLGDPRVRVFDTHALKTSLSSEEAVELTSLEAAFAPKTSLSRCGAHVYTFLDDQPVVKLSSGAVMPLVGLGTWKSEPGQVQAAVEAAVRAGYRHIDCAYVYENEHEVGAALRNLLAEGVVRRSDLFITSKLWNTFHAPAAVTSACRRSLVALGLDYLDLYLIHWPVTGQPGPVLTPPYASTWASMEALVAAGLVRSIGVSNLSARKLGELIKVCSIPPEVNQVEAHPFFRNDALLSYCARHGVHVTAFAPLGSPDSASVIQRKYTPSLVRHPVVTRLASEYGVDAGQVLIRWAVQRGTSVLPKSVTPSRIISNIGVTGWELRPADFDALSALEPQVRMVDGSFWLDSRGPYRSLSELWDSEGEDERQAAAAAAAYTNTGGLINGVPMPTAKLSSGHSMPLIGLGTWKSARGEVKAAVEAAIRMGYRHIDCAEVYQNEHEVGEALSVIFSEGVVTRAELFITSKLWNSDHAPERVEAAARHSLKALQLDYLDLYLIHWPSSGWPLPSVTPPYASTWASMEALVGAGLVRSIGVSNLSARKMGELLKVCTIPPTVNQVEAHLYWRNAALLAFCTRHSVHVTAYSPLGSPDSAGIMGRDKTAVGPMRDKVVVGVAERLGRSTAQVLLRWALQRGTSVLPKSVHPERLASNLDVLSWSLPDDNFEALSSLETQTRMVPGTFLLHPHGPYLTLEELWDEPQGAASSPRASHL
ncbi:hypothetical protein FOA52_007557 [Chlamydomonas sp. UWO 241]|nr:hypothetical protein FOA52_007557 [Chlamydomonas sp. UWO 241]